MAADLIIPSQIPWDRIKGKDLEELLYWLFDSMGAKDLEWRVGGKGSGAADQGRDLECSFYVSSPEGELIKQKWWVEAKGRKKTVEPTEIKESVINASGKRDIDVLVIATNSFFSNPTRDWVREWQVDHPKPIVKLWERTQLENLCSKNPLAVIRLFSEALSPQGKLEVIRSKFWNYANYTDEPTLDDIWKFREKLSITPDTLLALVASEFANGNINKRSWATIVSDEIVVNSLVMALINFFYLLFRANAIGLKQEPFFKACGYLILYLIYRIGAKDTANLLKEAWNTVEDREYPEPVRKIAIQPILTVLLNEIKDVCSEECSRISADKFELTEKEIADYWQRLLPEEGEIAENDRILIFWANDKPCNVGFKLNKNVNCPLFHCEKPEENLEDILSIIEQIMKEKMK